MTTNWPIALSIPESRRVMLQSDISSGDLMARIASGARHSGARWHPASFGRLIGAVRFEVFIEACDADAVDYFHNGRSGYRAQYAISEKMGQDANVKAVAAVVAVVRDAMATLPNAFNVDTEAVLAASEAKLWIDQDIHVLRRALRGEMVQPELLVEPWLRSAKQREFVVIRGKPRFKANAGVLAPIPARLAFRSAWWSDSRVVADPDKLDRSRHLHIFGFA